MKKNNSREIIYELYDTFFNMQQGIIDDKEVKIRRCYFFFYLLLIDNEFSQFISFDYIKKTLITDLYIDRLYKFNFQDLDSCDIGELFELTDLINSNSVDFFFDIYTVEDSVKSVIDFRDSSAYEKILKIKSLGKNNVNQLVAYNQFFIEDYNKYNVDINEEFFIRQISKWSNAFGEERALVETYNFLLALKSINDEEFDKALTVLEIPNLDIIEYEGDTIEFLKMFYKNNKNKNLTK